ncbi:hypothetical protein [Sporisorium scitamineum]|uniref:Uncharacterized protein n=1 Tax=Sporisorium scitamineum TaxID=49012 RepID=A0A0F7S6J8_9BASI|nr:hypothetical protein [Sporisorium scitamineum]
MAVKTRKSAAASSKAGASSEHLHPSSAAKSKPSTSSSSSTASTVQGDRGTHIPPQSSSHSSRHANPYQAANSWTWDPIKLIERKLFRAYWNVEATFVLSMLETWEVFLVIVVFVILTLLLWYSLIHYFPRHAQQVATRALYYLWASLDADKAASNSNPEVVDRLISNLNKVKQMMGSSAKTDL